jgi:hypothetical protein
MRRSIGSIGTDPADGGALRRDAVLFGLAGAALALATALV